MQNVKIPTTKSYQTYLIDSLKDPEEAAGYLEALLEENHVKPELFTKVLSNIIEALGENSLTPKERQKYTEKINELSSTKNILAIYELNHILNALGLKISIQAQDKSLT